jgi:hypothetical protein
MSNTNTDDFKVQATTATNEKLCEIVVVNRYLGLMEKEAVICMEELATRRANGDTFEYEKQIDEVFNTLPKFKLDMKKILNQASPNISSIFSFLKK